MKIICNKCGSENVFCDLPKYDELPETQTMDDLSNSMTQGVPLVYKMTTYKCGDCGYSISF